MAAEIHFAADPESVKQKSFLPSLYMRREGDSVEIGMMNAKGYDYAWSTISLTDLQNALILMFPEVKT